ncbi:L,D-transpeptidase family protein [Sinorhizobium meliloti]|nr:L,D-transpeptidase family protein [Sinorhizobium meliloti]
MATNQIFSSNYGPVEDHGYAVPGVPINRVRPAFPSADRRLSDEGTPGNDRRQHAGRFLYYVLPGGKAVRYGIGVGKRVSRGKARPMSPGRGMGRPGTRRRKWPNASPEVARYVEAGMARASSNPLGARALYLFNKEGRDTLFRLHGTPEWSSIGTAASSGCIRLMNQDIIDLYSRVRPGRNARVVVQQ